MKKIYTVYDRVSEKYMQLELADNDISAMRAFIISCSDPDIPETFLNDISLVSIGEYDENTGIITPFERVRTIMFGTSPQVMEIRKTREQMNREEVSKDEESEAKEDRES